MKKYSKIFFFGGILLLFAVGIYFLPLRKPKLENKFWVENRNNGNRINHSQNSSNGNTNSGDLPSRKVTGNPEVKWPTEKKTESTNSDKAKVSQTKFNPPTKYEIPQKTHTYQSFNNCGPATLSMALSYYDVKVDQAELGNQMRPYQNPKGDNDDKTIFTYEFVNWAKTYGKDKNLQAINLPNGDIELLKLFIMEKSYCY